jgi:tetratricopeptide (TPR) repeat protein
VSRPGAADRDATSSDAITRDGGPALPNEGELALSAIDRDRLAARFRVKRLLGTGGMGVVVEVHDLVLHRDVAVKLLYASEDDARTRFLREARAAGTLRHPGIVTVHDVDPDAGFIVMELVTGGSLAERLARESCLPPAEVRRIASALLAALEVAHAAGIVHRDVKPANILFDDQGMVKLADFGIASFGDSQLTSTGVRIGTPDYMAPEQLRGRACDRRADIYAAGATLYEAATGRKLHHDEGRVRDPARDVRAATGDERLARAIARAVEERAGDRFATAAELAAAISERTQRRSWRLAIAGAGVLALGVGIAVATLAGSGPASERSISSSGSQAPGELEEALGIDRLLELGVAAAQRNDLEAAQRLLGEVVAREPDLGAAYPYLALVLEWQGKPVGEILAAVEKGLATSQLEPATRLALEGLRLLVVRRHREALAYFQAAVEGHPHDVMNLYGLFEAQFHAGLPDASMRTYRRLVDQSPQFRIGMYHPLAYYIARGDADGVEWALARTDPVMVQEWRPNALIGRRAYGDAIAALERAIATEKRRTPTTALIQLIGAFAIAGRLDRAVETADALADKDRPAAALPQWALRVVRGESPGPTRATALRAPATHPVGITRLEAWLRLAMLAVVADPESVPAIASGLEAARRDEPGEILQADVGLAFLGGTRGDADLEARARRDGFVEAVAVADAFAAERAGRNTEAADAWRRAIAATSDGRFLALEWYFLARMLRALGDHAETIAACREVIEPRVFGWSWAGTVGTCLVWTAEAQIARGDPAAARATYLRLLALRTRAATDDPLVAAARAALSGSDKLITR